MIHIIDDFYPNPDEVRANALTLTRKSGNKDNKHRHPGSRSDGTYSDQNRIYLRNRFTKILGKNVVTFSKQSKGTNFNYSEDPNEFNWVHFDWVVKNYGTEYVMWASVIFLTPDAPLDAGTALFRKKDTKDITVKGEWKKGSPWKGSWFNFKDQEYEPHTLIGNIYNRCILYRGDYYHTAINAGFPEGRLTQVTFFQADV